MDPLSVTSALLILWFVQNISIASQEASKEVGKGTGEGIVNAAKGLVNLVRNKLSGSSDPKKSQIADQISQGILIEEDQLTSVIDQLAQNDADFANILSDQIQVIRNTLLNTLDARFTARDLNQVYFLLGEDADRLAGIGVPHKAKAEELIKQMETRRQLPNLIQKMIQVNSSIVY